MKKSIFTLIILSLTFIAVSAQKYNESVMVTNPNDFPLGLGVNTTYSGEWAREIGFSYNGTGKLFTMGTFANSGNLIYGYIGGNTTWDHAYTIPWMTFSPLGNIGIGTTNPSQKLVVGNDIGTVTSRNAIVVGDADSPSIWLAKDQSTNAWIDFTTSSGKLAFNTRNAGTLHQFSLVLDNGNVGIGTYYPAYKLDVAGTIRACEIKVELSSDCTADFVFEEDYNLRPLNEVEDFIKENKHLPEIASAEEMVENGISLNEMNGKLLQKIEELTLYVIEQNKEIQVQNKKLEEKDEQVEDLISNQKNLINRIEELEK